MPSLLQSWSSVVLGINLAAASVIPRNVTTNAPTVALKNGSYYGVYSSQYDQDYFLGMRFAQAPVGDLRLRQPQSLNNTWAGLQNATTYQPECIGYGSDQWVLGNYISEDCLSVNVVRPAGVDTTAKLPVAVFFNPGGYYEGGNSDPRYNMSFIVQQSMEMGTPFIAVSPNYRLSLYGFMYSQEVVDAGVTNLGMLDQRLALHWIQENIEAFGGDTTKVTIWGESAGAGSVGAQLVAYGGRDDKLFRGAISESGFPSGLSSYPTVAEWQPIYNYIVESTNCTAAADTLACLRTVSSDALSTVFNSTFNGSIIGSASNFSPQIDGDMFVAAGSEQLKNGQFVKVPYLMGTNFDEGASFATEGINTTAEFVGDILSANPSMDNATVDTILALYPDIPEIGIPATLHGRPSPESGYGAQWKRVAAYTGDRKMHAGRRLASQSWASNNVTAYAYHFNVLVNGATAEMGAGHFREVAFVFDDTTGLGYNNSVSVDPYAGEPETFDQLAEMMSRMWVSFIVNQDPNEAQVSNVTWPRYTLDNPQNLVFDVNVTDLAYAEPDTYRAEGINYIIDNMWSVFRQ
ncbi:carboxylesterase family protein [Coniella lustricola]|uniref:Carboxylic ester hydrolase n=1 Tax=Coniella lustricola TaxID=2025994 RepID=A0A2T3A1I4_9PEZI|nr:carboxylesterase family protein [Coniella lustricola]